MVLISKSESKELNKMGFKFGSDGSLHKTYSRHPKYYLTESKEALKALNKLRESKRVK